MPILKNARHEKFAQARAKGNTVDEAYVARRLQSQQGKCSTFECK